VTIGLTAIAFYTFSATPLMFEATAQMGLDTRQAVSWYVATFLTSMVTSLVLSWRYRMPIPVGWSLPGLVFLTATAANYSHAEMMGGVILTGIGMVLLGVAGVAERLVQWIPLPVVMGVFAGSVFGYVTSVFDNLQGQPWIVGAAVAGYFAAFALRRAWMPPMAAALIFGIAAALLAGEMTLGESRISAPVLVPIRPEFAAGSMLGIAVPLLLMAIGMGNVQAFGIMRSEGFEPPIRAATLTMGLGTIANALFGGHVSTLQSNGTAIMTSTDAGPHDRRYMSTIIASMGAGVLAVAAGSLGMVLGLFPAGLMPALAGLAIMTSLAEAMRKALSNDFPLSGFVAMMIAASSFTLFDIGAPLWGFVGGTLVAMFVERDALRRYFSVATAS
jgi:benzoate membrane transport protein